jgi:hypothetical protein
MVPEHKLEAMLDRISLEEIIGFESALGHKGKRLHDPFGNIQNLPYGGRVSASPIPRPLVKA